MSIDECIEKQFLFLMKNSVLHIPLSFRSLINEEYNIYEDHTLSGWDFVWLMFQSILDLESKLFQVGKFPSLLETTYKMSKNIQGCTGKIDILKDGYMMTETQKNPFRYSIKNIYFDEFMKEFSSRVEKCKFTGLALGYDLHENMILIYNGEKEITITLYEPHGSKYFSEEYLRYKVTLNFTKKLAEVYNEYGNDKKMIFIKPEDISCPMGYQSTIESDGKLGKGYCVMHSYFWLYMILHCTTNFRDSEKDVVSIIKNIEKTMLKRDSYSLTVVINNFAVQVVNTYVSTLTKAQQNYFYNYIPVLGKYFIERQEMKDIKADIKTKTKNSTSVIGFDVGSPCIVDDDCKTEKCVNDICKKPCEKNEDCGNDVCVNDVCETKKIYTFQDYLEPLSPI